MGRTCIAMLIASLLAAGCQLGGNEPQAVNSGAFFAPTTAPTRQANAPAPRPPLASGAVVPPAVAAQGDSFAGITAPVQAPTTLPAQGGSFTEYQTAGALVTTVSGTPIYADKVLAKLAPKLSADAKRMNLYEYQQDARQQAAQMVEDMVRSELYYLAANRGLSADDRKLVDTLTTMFRDRLITESGGSEAVARQHARDDGLDFSEKIAEENRRITVQLYRIRKIEPQITPTAAEMREFYDLNRDKLFTETARAQFRVIKISAAAMPGDTAEQRRSAAIDLIKELHDKAVDMTNEEFGKLAGSTNHDKAWMAAGGRVVTTGDGFVDKNAFRISEVEDAVWKIQPGQTTDPVAVGDSWYIARLEQRKAGRVLSFEDDAVQQRIAETMEGSRRAIRESEILAKLYQDSVINPYPPLYERVLEMALQMYPEWSGK